MSEKIPYEQVMRRMRMDIDYIADEAYQKGFEAGSHEATTIQYQKGLDDANKTNAEVCKLAHEVGQNDAWECARKICLDKEDGGISSDELMEIFNVGCDSTVFKKYSASEAIAKLKDYEQQKATAEIKVGDEVRSNNAISDHSGIVLALSPKGNSAKVLVNDGSMMWVATNVLIKTGRHFNFLTSLLEAMKGEQRNCSKCEHDGDPRFCDPCRHNDMWQQKEVTE